MSEIPAAIAADEPVSQAAAPEATAPELPSVAAAARDGGGFCDQPHAPYAPRIATRAAAPGAGGEFPGRIRYSAASAMRIEGNQWQDGRSRRRPRRRALLAAGVALLVLGTGWTLYDHTPRRLAETTAGTAPAVSPQVEQPYAAVLEPSHTTADTSAASAGVAQPPVSGGPASTGAESSSPAATAPSEPWWRPSGAERLRADLPPAGYAPSDIATATGAAAPRREEAASVAGLNPASVPLGGGAVSRPAAPPEPVARPVVIPKSPPAAAAKPRPPVTTAVPPQPEMDAALAARVPEAKPPLKGREALLNAGDEQMANGDVQAARVAYQEAFEKGSAEAARRLAQTFDPRNVAAHSSDASPAEAILWYKDAARRGDRRVTRRVARPGSLA